MQFALESYDLCGFEKSSMRRRFFGGSGMSEENIMIEDNSI